MSGCGGPWSPPERPPERRLDKDPDESSRRRRLRLRPRFWREALGSAESASAEAFMGGCAVIVAGIMPCIMLGIMLGIGIVGICC